MAVIQPRWPINDETGPVVRGDPCTMLFAFSVDGVDEDISSVTFRSMVRASYDTELVSECTDFDVLTKDDFPTLFPGGGSTPCVLVVSWSAEQTREWRDGYVCDVERIDPDQRTEFILSALWVHRDVSYEEGS